MQLIYRGNAYTLTAPASMETAQIDSPGITQLCYRGARYHQNLIGLNSAVQTTQTQRLIYRGIAYALA